MRTCFAWLKVPFLAFQEFLGLVALSAEAAALCWSSICSTLSSGCLTCFTTWFIFGTSTCCDKQWFDRYDGVLVILLKLGRGSQPHFVAPMKRIAQRGSGKMRQKEIIHNWYVSQTLNS